MNQKVNYLRLKVTTNTCRLAEKDAAAAGIRYAAVHTHKLPDSQWPLPASQKIQFYWSMDFGAKMQRPTKDEALDQPH